MIVGTAKTILLSLMLLQPSSIANVGMTMTAAYCYDANGLLTADCQCHPSCLECGFSDDPSSENDCITCADSNLDVFPIYDDGTGYCNAVENPCVVEAITMILCFESACPAQGEAFANTSLKTDCPGAVAGFCKVVNGEECATCATEMKEFLQCMPSLTKEQLQTHYEEDEICWDTNVCTSTPTAAPVTSAPATSAPAPSAASTKFGYLAISFIWAATLLAAAI